MPLWEKSQQTLRGKLDGRDPTLGEKNSLRNAEVVRLVVIQWPAGLYQAGSRAIEFGLNPASLSVSMLLTTSCF